MSLRIPSRKECISFWEQATSPFNLDTEEYVQNVLKGYGVSLETRLPYSYLRAEGKTCRGFKRVLGDDQIYVFCLLRYAMRKVRRGMDGIEKGPQLVALADILIGGLWQAFVQRKLTAVELVKLIEYHLQKWCIVFEKFPIHRSYQNAVRREKKRIRMGKGRSSFQAGPNMSTPENVIRIKLLQKIEHAGYILEDDEEASKLMLGAVDERVKQVLSVMSIERNERNAYYEVETRANYLREVMKYEFDSENEKEDEPLLQNSNKPISLQSLLLKQQKAILVNRVNNARSTRTNSNPSMIPSLAEFLKGNKKLMRTNKSAGPRPFRQLKTTMLTTAPLLIDDIIPYMIENTDEFRNEFRNKWIEHQECKAFYRTDLNETNYENIKNNVFDIS